MKSVAVKSMVYGLIAFGVIVIFFYIFVSASRTQRNNELVKVCTESMSGTVFRADDYRYSKKVTIGYELDGEKKVTPEIKDRFGKFKWYIVDIHYNPDNHSQFYFGNKPDPAFDTESYALLVFAIIGMVGATAYLIRSRIRDNICI